MLSLVYIMTLLHVITKGNVDPKAQVIYENITLSHVSVLIVCNLSWHILSD